MSGFAWYVVQSHPKKETFVRRRLEELEREVFLPMVAQRIPGRRGAALAPLFPSYLFARLSADGGDLPRVRWSPGVRRLLGQGERPRPVSGDVVECIRERTDRAGRVKLGRRLKRGDRVRIVEGPLAGLVGILERPPGTAEQRVLVLLDVFHRLTRVELPAHAVWEEAAS